MAELGGFDKTTAAIVRLEEKVSRLEEDFRELKADMKGELSDIKEMLNAINLHISQKEVAVKTSKAWIAAIVGIISFVVSIGATIAMRVFIK